MPEKMFCLRLKSREHFRSRKTSGHPSCVHHTADRRGAGTTLRGRGTETEEVIKGRMERAKEEAQGMDQYDYV